MILIPNPMALQSAAYAPGQAVSFELLLQNMTFGGFPSWSHAPATLKWSATLGGKVITSQSTPLALGSVPQGSTGTMATAAFTIPPRAPVPEGGDYMRLVISATVQLGSVPFSTSWTLGVFPTPVAPGPCDKILVADAAMLPAARLRCSNAVGAVPAAGKPFIFLGRSLNGSMAAQLNRPGCFALLVEPTGFPACESGGIGHVPAPAVVSAGLPWWMNSGFVGTFLYNSSLWRGAAARELVDLSFLPFEFSQVGAGSAWTLDNATKKASHIVTHVRAIPADGDYGASVDSSITYVTTIKDYALVFEADLPSPSTARVLVSGLNIMNSSGLPGVGPGRWIFDTLIQYAIRNSVARKPEGMSAAAAATAAVAAPSAFCPGPASFCRAGAESPCTIPFAAFKANGCGKDFAIVQSVSLASTASVTALKIKLQGKTAGSLVVPLLYDGASGKPGKLIANGTAVPLAVTTAPQWLSLPLAEASLAPGKYFIGALYSADVSCWAGAGNKDTYAMEPFADGPLPGTKLSWTTGTLGTAVYAVTA